MIIGFDGRYAAGNLVGIGNYIKNLIEHISEEQECIIFYSKRPKYPIKGRNIRRVILPTENDSIFEQILLPRSLKKYKIDLFHATGNVGIPVFPCVKSLLTVHDLIPLEVKNYFAYSKFPALSKYLYFFRLYSSCLKAKKIISESEYTKKRLVKLGISPNKIKVIRLGVNLPKKVNFKYIEGDYILNNGGIDIRKNLDILVSSFAIVHKKRHELKLIITGQNKTIIPKLKELVSKLHLQQVVIFVGYVDDSKLASLIRYTKCLCYPSLNEGFGFPILEAFSYGVPVISSNTSSIPEIAKNASILVNPKNEKQIAGAILEVLKDNKLANKLRRLGLERVKEFSWGKAANEYLDLYNSLK